MKTYNCVCGQLIFFENVACVNCKREIGFLPNLPCLTSLDPADNGLFKATAAEANGALFKKCQNYATQNACNWMISADNAEAFCVSCRLDETIPDLSLERNVTLWKLIENAKRRLVYTLLSLELPLANRADDPTRGLMFRFLADQPNNMVLTGHDEGIITLNIAEADDAEREKRRLSMKEPYRTLLGHFRHEIGHYYWDRLVRGTDYLPPFRKLFGDESVSYDEALKKYYASGAPPNWQDNFISVYATAHPWEDWAETWAHYLHIQDTLEVALDFGLVDKRVALEAKDTPKTRTWFASKPKSFEEKIDAWSELTIALNSINRSMGLPDIYPFVLSKPVVEKLRFISEVIAGREAPAQPAPQQVEPPDPAGPVTGSVEPPGGNIAPSVPNL